MKPIEFLKDERALEEIEKHKWFESEKSGCDVGFENAAADWIQRFGEEWAKYNCSQIRKPSPKPAAVKAKRGRPKKAK